MAKKIIPITDEDLLRLKTALQITVKKMQEEKYDEQETRPYQDLYASLCARKAGNNLTGYLFDVNEEEEEDGEE